MFIQVPEEEDKIRASELLNTGCSRMEKIVLRVVVLLSVCCLSKKHVFVNKKKNWGEARKYCQDQFIDISPLTNKQEEEIFKKRFADDKKGWIGIYWDKPTQKWKWSGGDNVSYHNNLDLPDNTNPNHLLHTADNVYWTNDGWEWRGGESNQDFFCFDLTVVQEEKTWEEAYEHCTQNRANLISQLSETENLLTTNKIQKTGVTQRVWIGLRFLGHKWLWVNGNSLDYENWRPTSVQCPIRKRCGALTKGGDWESWDCLEKLSFICG